MNLRSLKSSKTIKDFLKYEFNTDGKYYLLKQGAKKYAKTYFKKVYDRHPDFFEIICEGNDAPRGGKLGDFVYAKPTKRFCNLFITRIDLPKSLFGGFYNGVFNMDNIYDVYEYDDREIVFEDTRRNICQGIVNIVNEKIRDYTTLLGHSRFHPKSYNYLTDVITISILDINIDKVNKILNKLKDIDVYMEMDIYDYIVYK